jgi:hypothetical protein
LVYVEAFGHNREVVAREKQIKGWLRTKKVTLIEPVNREWKDLASAWIEKAVLTAAMGNKTRRLRYFATISMTCGSVGWLSDEAAWGGNS